MIHARIFLWRSRAFFSSGYLAATAGGKICAQNTHAAGQKKKKKTQATIINSINTFVRLGRSYTSMPNHSLRALLQISHFPASAARGQQKTEAVPEGASERAGKAKKLARPLSFLPQHIC